MTTTKWLAPSDSATILTKTNSNSRKKLPSWFRPTFSPEHGVLLVLFGSFITGAALAQHWTYTTTMALVCAFFTLQIEHPYVMQIKLRKNFKPRFVLWGSIYTLLAGSLAIFLWFKSPSLIWIYLLAITGFIADGVFVLQRQHKSIANEIISFAAICLSTPLAYGATTGNLSTEAMAMWILNTLFFSSAVFTIKLRRKKNPRSQTRTNLSWSCNSYGVRTLRTQLFILSYSLNF